MERSSGMRKMQTFRKLPITNPSTKMKAMTKVRAAQSPYVQCAIPLVRAQRNRSVSVSDA
jgi:hypothetical protein